MQEHAEAAALTALGQHAFHGRHHLGPALGIGGVDVEEVSAAAERLHVGGDALGRRQRGPPVEVDPEDVEAGPGQGAHRGGTEAGRGAEHESPAGETDRSGGRNHASSGILS